MKKIIQWTVFVLVAVAAMAAGMYCLAQCLDSKEPSSGKEAKDASGKSSAKSFTRHYIKLNLS